MSLSNDPTFTPSASNETHPVPSSSSQIRVFLPPETSTSFIPPPNDDELKPTPAELREAFKSSILGRNGPDAPLLTRAMREKEEARLGLHSSRNRTFHNVRIRIRFSDRTMIESSFNETDTMDAVYKFLEDSVDERFRAKGVVIYTSPPKVEYQRSVSGNRDNRKNKGDAGKTLRELGLIPSAVVNLRWDDPSLNSELKAQAQPLTSPPSSLDQPQSPSSAAGASSTTSGAANSNGGGSSGKDAKPMPKWLKSIVTVQ
ncbi:uncharacterized protein MEPE_06420 [Melanopsichium pennsylvanicum]|uniref:UBX domain-containing protein n=1 Tax=Melanopsichium pennsylvanicum TaxID=63383 RepID=A0AAJ4XRU7_9BASI|nr:uncharacterized protein MEPE_06420 [Melanopsichium pennsylvanicum]